jgi:hypothetical protein
MEEKVCSKCKIPKSITEFVKNKSTKDGYHHQCKECCATQRIKYQNSEKGKILNKYSMIKYRYGLTKNNFIEILNKQNNSCPICGLKFIVPIKINVDHDHKTNITRGLLCHRCNMVLGLINDNVDILDSIKTYLSMHENNNINDVIVQK